MKYLACQGNNSKSKYYTGKPCYEEVLVEDTTVATVCWKCVQHSLPTPNIPHKPTGYPRGWKFMNEFVDKDGNVFHKGEIQKKLFGKRKPTIIKVIEKKPKKMTLDEKIAEEYSKRVTKRKRTKLMRKLTGAKR